MTDNTILADYEYKGIKYNRISMLNSIKIQKKIASLFDKLDLAEFLSPKTAKNEAEALKIQADQGVKLVRRLYDNIEDLIEIFEICGQDIEKLMAGQEFDFIEGLLDHPDFKVIIEKLKGMTEVKGKIGNLFKSKK